MKISIVVVLVVVVSVGIYQSMRDSDREATAIEVSEEQSIETSEIGKGPTREKDPPPTDSKPAIPGGESSDRPPRTFLENDGLDRLFADIPDDQLSMPEVEAFLAKRHILEYRIVSADSDQLRTIIRDIPRTDSFDIRLLDSEPVTLVTTAAEEHTEGWKNGFATWIGAVDGDELGTAMLFVSIDGSLSGQTRTTDDGVTKIENIPGTAAHLIWRRTPGFGKKPD